MTTHQPGPSRYKPDIDAALSTPGGHLSIGRGGFTLHFGNGARLSGYDIEPIKAECIAAGRPSSTAWPRHSTPLPNSPLADR
ncbi:MAG: hypothetical protein AB7F74_18100 [Parvibaculaceae bacterium]